MHVQYEQTVKEQVRKLRAQCKNMRQTIIAGHLLLPSLTQQHTSK